MNARDAWFLGRVAALAALLVALLPAGENSFAQALGTWKMDAKKSSYNTGPFPKALTVKYEPHSAGEVVTWHEVRADGTSRTLSHILRFNAKEYALAGERPQDEPETVIARRVDNRTVEVLYKKNGKLSTRLLRTISSDGRQMTIELVQVQEKSAGPTGTLVFDRQPEHKRN